MPTDPVLSAVEAALTECFGHRPQRASVSFVGVEPIEILRFEPIPGERAYLSLGMSRHPMTGADESMLAAEGPRAELMLHLRDPTDSLGDIWRRLAVLAASPAVEGVVYRAGMTVDVGEPLVAGASCSGGVLADSPFPAFATPAGEVALLLVVPITPNELAWARVRGSEALSERLHGTDVDLLDLARRSVDLN
ncbi:MAG: suppressor of fused domain protein [Actinomycetota bacterium]|nr:suppressor of fused domain protein [Actinomycetota bacterium]